MALMELARKHRSRKSDENREAKEVDNSWNRTECFLYPMVSMTLPNRQDNNGS